MRNILISAAILSSVAMAAPATAQYRGYGHGYNQGPTRSAQIENQLQQLRDRIRRAEDRDLISEREEDRLLRRLGNIADRYDRFRRNGLNRREHDALRRDLQNLRQRIQSERREGRFEDRRDRWDGRDGRRGRRW